jgi:hypothetical protein
MITATRMTPQMALARCELKPRRLKLVEITCKTATARKIPIALPTPPGGTRAIDS